MKLSCDLLVNAVIQPANRFTLRGLRRDRSAGAAIQTFFVSNPGQISVAGRGVRSRSSNVAEAGRTTLGIAATGAKKRKLRKRGQVKLKPTFTFEPMGGTPSRMRATITLKRR